VGGELGRLGRVDREVLIGMLANRDVRRLEHQLGLRTMDR